MKRILWIAFVIGIGYFSGTIYLKYINHHPIKLKHPFPQLSRKVPIIQTLDKWFSLTAGIDWYKVKSRAGIEYFAEVSHTYERGKGWIECWRIMDAKKRDKWIWLTRPQFEYLFSSPADGKGYAFPYDLKDR